MWNIGDKNLKLKGQMTGFAPAGAQLSCMEKGNFPPSTGRSDKLFLAEPPGKGEANFHIGSMISDDVSSLYRGNLGDRMQNVSVGMISPHNLHMANVHQGIHMFPERDVQLSKPNILLSQYEGSQFCDPNSFSTSHHIKPSCQSNMLIGEYSQPPYSQHLMHGLASQAEAGKFQSYAGEGCVSKEKAQADGNSRDVINLATRNSFPPNNTSFSPVNASRGSEKKPSEFSHSGIHKNELDGHELKFVGRNFSGSVCYGGTSTDVSKDYNMGMSQIPDVSLNLTPTQISAATERSQSHGPHRYPKIEVQSSHYPHGNAGASFYAKDQEKNESGMPERPFDCNGALLDCARLNRSSSEAHASRNLDRSDSGNENSSLKERASLETGIMVNKPAAPSGSRASLTVDSISKISSVKVAPTATEKLWDGTLQLNTSTVVSAIAVFKSGEKVSEVNWSKHVEVKGKVRMEAFEKFVQELPRSRTRALMVISIYWKLGSSEAGLTGMKEVAKGYKEGQRVGFAQLCPGIDLYVCPRSDAIITILAKYGFFKGMAAVEEDQNSLIGCVVWRRNHPSSDFALKKNEKNEIPSLEQPIDSPSGAAISNSAEQNSLITKTMDLGCNQVMPDFKVPAGASSPVKPLSPENVNINEIEKIKCINVPNNVISSNNNVAPVLAPSPTYLSSVAPQFPMSAQNETHPEDPRKCVSHATTLFRHDAASRKPQVGVEASSQVLSGAPQKLEDNHRSSRCNDDDDLPEFDFGNAYGVLQLPDSRLPSSSHNHHPSEVPPHNQQLPLEANRSASVPMPPQLPSVKHPTYDAPYRPHASPTFGLMQDANLRFPLPKEVEVPSHRGWPAARTIESSGIPGDSETVKNSAGPAAKSFFPQKMLETVGPSSRTGASEMENLASQATKSSFVHNVQRRPIWDDDDMPEWCPPNMDNGQLPPTPVLPLPLPSPPSLQPMLPAIARPLTLSSFLTPPSASTLSGFSKPPPPPEYDQNISHQRHPGILGGRPLDSNPKIPMQTRPATRFGRPDWRASPEPNPDQAKRQRRVTGWDVKPWEVKPERQHGQRGRH